MRTRSMSAKCRFCCRSLLQAFLVSDSVAVTRFAKTFGFIGFGSAKALPQASLIRLLWILLSGEKVISV
jgi:hypothetical protein